VETIYRHDRLQREELELGSAAFERDLFGETTWRVLGLDTWQLVRAGVIGGAAVGGVVDVAAGGASFLAGSIVGGLLGGLSSYYGSQGVAQMEVLGRRLGGPVARIGPLRNPNFPWLLLDRALLHFRSVISRAHARRDALVLPEGAKGGVVAQLEPGLQSRLSRVFASLPKSGAGVYSEVREELIDALEDLLTRVESSKPAARLLPGARTSV
jgi:hypothetical protein